MFSPERDVATLTPEFRNRWQAVLRDGSVAFRPTPPPPGPWVKLGHSLVSPGLLERVAEGWKDPAGFVYPYEGELPAVAAAEPQPAVPDVPCERQQIYSLTKEGKDAVWHTDVGDFRWPDKKVGKAAAVMPELACVETNRLFINPERLRRICRKGPLVTLVMDNGAEYTRQGRRGAWSRALGLTSLSRLEPCCLVLWNQRQLRDWPFDLTQADGEVLREHFPTSRRLCANAIWQQYRYLQLEVAQQVATSHRDLWYKVAPMLYRAGFLKRFMAYEHTTKEGLQYTLEFVLSGMIEARLFNYKELGFIELHPEWRRIGTRRPEIVIVTEKHSIVEYALRLCEEFGVSLLMLDGSPSLVGSEFFRDAYVLASEAPIFVVAAVDYETLGWVIGRGAEKQLKFYGLETSRPLRFLFTGDVFTEEEKRLYARPLPASNAMLRTKNAAWVKESGGVDGAALGIHSNHVQPYERVRELFVRVLEG